MKIAIIARPVEFTLKIAGLWPDYFNIFETAVVASAMVTMIPFQWWDVIRLIDDPVLLSDTLGNLLSEVLLYLKLIVMWINRRCIEDLLREMSKDYERKEMVAKLSTLVNYSHRFCKFDYSLYLCASSFYYLQFILMYVNGPVEGRELMIKAYYPFDYKSSPNFEIMTAVQFFQGISMYCVYALSESLLVTLVLHICGHIDVLLDEIDSFSRDCRSGVCVLSLKSVIKQHLKILNMVEKVETIYTYISLVQVCFSAVVMCVLVFIILKVIDSEIIIAVKYGMLYLALCWQVYSFCFAGQHLINKSEEVLDRLYDTSWYNAKPSEVKALFFIICRAQSPLSLTAGNYITLSAKTFTLIMKTSFSYFSVLRASYI